LLQDSLRPSNPELAGFLLDEARRIDAPALKRAEIANHKIVRTAATAERREHKDAVLNRKRELRQERSRIVAGSKQTLRNITARANETMYEQDEQIRAEFIRVREQQFDDGVLSFDIAAHDKHKMTNTPVRRVLRHYVCNRPECATPFTATRTNARWCCDACKTANSRDTKKISPPN
jgi:hypothetical protein